MAKRENFTAAMVMLGAAFNRELSKPLLDAYWAVLSVLANDELAAATNKALRECKFMPTPAELLAFTGRSRELEAAEAWEAVRWAMDRYDYTASVDFGALVNAVVRNMGGWQWLCDQTVPDLVWRRKEFEKLYVEMAYKPSESLRGGPLRGAFGGTPARVAIAGKLPPLAIAEKPSEARAVVKELATKLSEQPIPQRPKRETVVGPDEKQDAIERMTAALAARSA